MIKDFLTYLQYEKNYSSYTVLSYRVDIKQFCDFLGVQPEQIEPKKINNQDISRWILNLVENKISARTISRKISTLKSLWKYLLLNGIVDKNPVKKVILPKTNKPLPSFYKDNEVQLALLQQEGDSKKDDFVEVRDNLIINLLYQSGLRVSELVSLRRRDIDLEARELKILGKRNKERKLPMGMGLIEEILRYELLKKQKNDVETDVFFVTLRGKKMYSKAIYNIVQKKMALVSTLRKQSPHILRHTFATTLLNNGADLNAVKELMGHSSLAATQVYTHLNFKELNKIYNQAHPRANKKIEI